MIEKTLSFQEGFGDYQRQLWIVDAMGLPLEEARASMRVSFGPVNSAADVDAFLEALAEEAAALRGAAVGAPLLL